MFYERSEGVFQQSCKFAASHAGYTGLKVYMFIQRNQSMTVWAARLNTMQYMRCRDQVKGKVLKYYLKPGQVKQQPSSPGTYRHSALDRRYNMIQNLLRSLAIKEYHSKKFLKVCGEMTYDTVRLYPLYRL